MLVTPGPWRVSEHDDCEIETADGSEFIGAIAKPHNAAAMAAMPELLWLAFDLADSACVCGEQGSCGRCRAQRLIAAFQATPYDD